MALSLRKKNKAFSLLELLMATAILSIGLITVLEALSFSMRVTGLSCDMVSAIFLAEDKMQELEFKEKQKLLGQEPQGARDTKDKFNWQYDIVLDNELSLYKLDFALTWQRLNREELLILNTYLLKE